MNGSGGGIAVSLQTDLHCTMCVMTSHLCDLLLWLLAGAICY